MIFFQLICHYLQYKSLQVKNICSDLSDCVILNFQEALRYKYDSIKFCMYFENKENLTMTSLNLSPVWVTNVVSGQ